MSSALLKKSLEIVENNDNCKHSRKKRSQKSTGIAKKKNTLSKITINDVQKQMQSTSGRIEKTVDKLLGLHSTSLGEKDIEKIAKRAKTGHYILPPTEPTVEVDSVFTEEDFKKFEDEYFDEAI